MGGQPDGAEVLGGLKVFRLQILRQEEADRALTLRPPAVKDDAAVRGAGGPVLGLIALGGCQIARVGDGAAAFTALAQILRAVPCMTKFAAPKSMNKTNAAKADAPSPITMLLGTQFL